MNLDPLSFALSQIQHLVTNLSKKNSSSAAQEIQGLVSTHGTEAHRHLLRCLFSRIDFNSEGKAKELPQINFLAKELKLLSTNPDFVSLLCFGVDHPLNHSKLAKAGQQIVQCISRTLHLTRVEEVLVAISLLQSSNPDTVVSAENFLKSKLPDLLKSYADTEGSGQASGLQDIGIDVLHQLLTLVVLHSDRVNIPTDVRNKFLEALCKELHPGVVPVVLKPLLYPDFTDFDLDSIGPEAVNVTIHMMESRVAEMLREHGCSVSGSVEEIKDVLRSLCSTPQALTPAVVARCLSMMVVNLPAQVIGMDKDRLAHEFGVTIWNSANFTGAVRELIGTNPKFFEEVIRELDHPGFAVQNRLALVMLIRALYRGLGREKLPLDGMFKPWNNAEGQFTLMTMSLRHPEVLCLGDHPSRQVQLDILKQLPDDDKEVATWKSLDVIECLLTLADRGFYTQCSDFLKRPITVYPEILALGIIQALPNQWTKLKECVIACLVPQFLNNHPNSGAVLQYLWQNHPVSNQIRATVMKSVAEWYLVDKHEQTRLSRILDISHDIKALSMLLNATSFPFIIDLACLASRRGYLKLEKWLADKINEHGEPFIEELVRFLKVRVPQLCPKEDQQASITAKAQQLPAETLNTMLTALHHGHGYVKSRQLAMDMQQMVQAGNELLQAIRSAPPTPAAGVPGMMPGSAPGVRPVHQVEPLAVLGALGVEGGAPGSFGGLHQGIGANPAGLAGAPAGLPGGPAGLGATPGVLGTAPGPLGAAGQKVPLPSHAAAHAAAAQGLLPHTSGALAPSAGGIPVGSRSAPASNNALLSGVGALGALGPSPSSTGQTNRAPQSSAVTAQAASAQQQAEITSFFPNASQWGPDVEAESNLMFQRLYSSDPKVKMPVSKCLALLKEYKESNNQHKKDVCHCMVKYLFDEYRFFADYPDAELAITAEVFGGLIEESIVMFVLLGVALRYVLEALKKPTGSKLFQFGVTALEKFKSKLKEYPQYCSHVMNLTNFSHFPRHVQHYLQRGMRAEEPDKAELLHLQQNQQVNSAALPLRQEESVPAPVPPPQQTFIAAPGAGFEARQNADNPPATEQPIGSGSGSAPTKQSITTANIDILIESITDDVKQPAEQVKDKISFIFNNLSKANLTEKATEMRGLILPDFLEYTAQYLITRRVATEMNFHSLYNSLLDALDIDQLLGIVTEETYRNITILLSSRKPVSSGYSERTLLKNLGNWLGLVTVARNRPILYLKLDLKGLLYEAHARGTDSLIMIVPFVATVLKGCVKSEIFKPNNPWTMGLLNVLYELYNEPGHKLNIKFEVEVLCRALDVDIATLTATQYLQDDRSAPLRQQLAPREVVQEEPLDTRDDSTASPASLQAQTRPPPSGLSFPTGSVAVSSASALTPQTNTTPQPMELLQQYRWDEIQTGTPQQINSSIAPLIRVNEQLELFQMYPVFKQAVAYAIPHAIQEVLPSVVERGIKNSISTVEHIARKDFSLDPDENRLLSGVQSLARHLISGRVHVLARENFEVSIQNQFKNYCLQYAAQQGITTSTPFLELVDAASKTVAKDNADLCTSFAVKSACEKMTPELNARFKLDFDMRRQARAENRKYCDRVILTYQAERVPEQIRLMVGGPTQQQMKLYEAMGRSVPGFNLSGSLGSQNVVHSPQTPVAAAATSSTPAVAPEIGAQAGPLPTNRQTSTSSASIDEHVALLDRLILGLESCLHELMLNAPQQQALSQSLSSLKEPLVLTRKSPASPETFSLFVNKVLESLLAGYMPEKVSDADTLQRWADCHVMLLRGLRDHKSGGVVWIVKAVAKFLVECREEYKTNVDAIELLVRQRLVHMGLYDQHLAESMESGLNYQATTFCMQLVKRFCSEDNASATFTEADFQKTIETLTNIATHSRQAPEGLEPLVQKIRTLHEGSFMDQSIGMTDPVFQSGLFQAREYDDPPGLHEKVELLLREWVTMYHSPSAGRDNTKAFTAFVAQMCQYGILKTDELITRFFRLCTEMCVDLCYRVLSEQNSMASMIRAKCFHTLDAYVRLIALLVKHSGDQQNVKTKTNLLNKVLGIVAGILLQDHEIRRTDFQQLPYHRIFIMLFIELNAPEHVLESINMEVLQAFCNVLHILRPSKAPGFAFAWLELISHRVVMARMLAITPQQKGWNMYGQLLIDLFKFLAPFLRNAQLTKSLQFLYKGSLRVLLVLLHDFPEFLCDFHYSFCDVLPPNCIQMRNMILSAFPRSMRLPDPFAPNLKVDMLQEVSAPPKIFPSYVHAIQPASFKNDLDSYLQKRAPVTFLTDLASKLRSVDDSTSNYNVPMLNALVLYVGSQAIKHIQQNKHTPSMTTIAHSSHMDIFQNLAVNLDTEGRYLLLNALVNQLRFPNSHTHYFSITLLYLFAEANKQPIQEQITRVLLERLIVNRPHPWGLLITFIDLIKNRQLRFWEHEFVHCAPEIEKLFENIARSCQQQRPTSSQQPAVSAATVETPS